MDYKIICPGCGTRLSRWRYFSTLSIYYRCPGCAARFRLTAKGFAITFAVGGVQILWVVLDLLDVISWYVAIDFLLATCALALWLLPLWTPVQAERPSNAPKP
jgi:apolipoprotein N-acyltransferase